MAGLLCLFLFLAVPVVVHLLILQGSPGALRNLSSEDLIGPLRLGQACHQQGQEPSDMASADVDQELRHLSPRHVHALGRIFDVDYDWKRLMGNIPKHVSDLELSSGCRFTTADIEYDKRVMETPLTLSPEKLEIFSWNSATIAASQADMTEARLQNPATLELT